MGIVGDAFSIGLNGMSAIGSFKEGREAGHGLIRSTLNAGVDFAFYEMLGAAGGLGLMAMQGAKAGLQFAHQAGYQNAAISSKAHRANFGGYYQDNQVAATMRQRGIQAMQQSRLQGYSTLGNEARRYQL